MSSGTQYMVGAGRKAISVAAGRGSMREAGERVKTLGLSERQMELSRMWAVYRAQQYDTRAQDWYGRRRLDNIELEQIATDGVLPVGYEDVGGQTKPLPLQFRRPLAPLHLGRLIVDRFTSLLFSEKRHPAVRALGDPDTEDWVTAFCDATRFWAQLIMARTYGGAMGSVATSFMYVRGRPRVEVHDPRWCTPRWADRAEFKLASLEKRYQYPEEVRRMDGSWETAHFWYRRIINEGWDIVWKPIEVGDGDEPDWENEEKEAIEHNLGFCPAYWIQNMPVQDSLDGDPDCQGAFDTFEEIDTLTAQADRALMSNCDPTLLVSSNAEMPASLKKGSDNAIQVPTGDSAEYLEINAQAIKATMDQANEHERRALQITSCVLERPDAANQKTATEVDRLWSSMLAKVDILREQYGQRGILPMANGATRSARKLRGPRVVKDGERGRVVRYSIELPKRPVKDKTGKVVKFADRVVGPEENAQLDLQWPRVLDANPQEVESVVRSAVEARSGGLIDADHATRKVAEYFDVEDPAALVERLKRDDQDQRDAEEQEAQESMRHEAEKGSWERPTISAAEMESGAFTMNEYRASKALPPWPPEDGDLTLPEFRQKYPERFATSTVLENPQAAEQMLGMTPPGGPGGGPGGGGPPGGGEGGEPGGPAPT